jgi:hypothetical protein
LDWSQALDNQVENKTLFLDWYISVNGGTSFTRFKRTLNEICVLWNNPITDTGAATAKRVDWSTNDANNATSISGAASLFENAIAISPGFNTPRATNWQPWNFLDTQQAGDCGTLAELAVGGLNMIGIAATQRLAYPTADGTSGFPAVSPSSCQTRVTKDFNYSGQTFHAVLIYPGNNFEGFFTVVDGGTTKAYTVYTPTGPYFNQDYYYLQVLRAFAAYQIWVWDGTQTSGGVTVLDGDDVPGQAHIPVPSVP